MAVTRVPDTARLVLRVQDGVDSKGAPVLKNRTFRNLKTDAADDAVLIPAASNNEPKRVRTLRPAATPRR